MALKAALTEAKRIPASSTATASIMFSKTSSAMRCACAAARCSVTSRAVPEMTATRPAWSNFTALPRVATQCQSRLP
jgi:hypothetical protein